MDLLSLVAKLTLDKSQYEQGLKGASADAEGFGSKLMGGLGTAAKAGAAAIGAASGAVVAFGKSAVDAGSTFDASMSQVAATMGYSVEELNTQGSEASKTFETLRNFAQEMGSQTAFSASESADALNYMALAGYDAETSMKMLPNVLNLAAAGGIGLADASDMVTDAQSALGLTLDETSQMVDKMARASSKSNTSVAQLGEAFLTIGGTAKNLSGGTTELATALGILADNGIKGSEGGTALRNILLNLTPKSEEAAEAFEKIGLKAYDADGEMRPLADIFHDLNEAMAPMTTEQRQNLLASIFNKVDLKSVNALLATSEERWVDLAGAIDDSQGAAEAMADTQLDNLAGDITLFESAMEGAKIAISDGLTPTLRNFVQFGSTGIGTLTTAFREKGLAGAMGVLGSLISDGLAMIMESLPQIVDAGVQLLMALTTGIIDNLPLLADAALQIITQLAASLAENLPTMIPTIVSVIMQIVDTLTEPSTLSALLDAALAIIIALAQGLIGAMPELIAKAPEIIMNLVTALIASVPQILEAALQLMVTFAEGIVANTKAAIDAIGKVWDSIVSSITGFIAGAVEWGANLLNTFTSGIVANINAVLKGISQMWDSIVKSITNFISGAVNWGKNLLDTFTSGIVANISSVVGGIGQMWDSIVSGVTGFISGAWDWGKDLIDNFTEGIKAFISKPVDAIKGLADKIKSFLGFSEPEEGPLSNFHTYAPDMMELFAKGITDNRHLITDAISSAFNVGGQITHTAATGAMTGHEFTMPSFMPRVAPTQINLILDNTVIGRALLPYIRAEEMRVGIELAGGVH